jgi:hypothetical protein
MKIEETFNMQHATPKFQGAVAVLSSIGVGRWALNVECFLPAFPNVDPSAYQ